MVFGVGFDDFVRRKLVARGPRYAPMPSASLCEFNRKAGFEKNTPLASGARPDAAQAKVGVSYAAALANNAHDHSVKGNFTWRF